MMSVMMSELGVCQLPREEEICVFDAFESPRGRALIDPKRLGEDYRRLSFARRSEKKCKA